MKRVLVVVDGSIESSIAIEYAIELATVTGGIELLLLNVRSPAPAWQSRTTRTDKENPPAKRILNRAARLSKMAGVPYRERSEEGEIPETVIRIAREEPCDLIVWPERGMGPVARAVLMLTGFSANAFVNKIISTSPVPVTVVTDSTARQMRPYHEVH